MTAKHSILEARASCVLTLQYQGLFFVKQWRGCGKLYSDKDYYFMLEMNLTEDRNSIGPRPE